MQKTLSSNQYRVFLDLLKEARRDAGLTQGELAERMNATQSFVSKCERGERRLDVIELRIWCDALGRSFVGFVTKLDQSTRKGG